MNTATVWLLVMFGNVNSGGLAAVQPIMFPTAAACEHVARNSTGIQRSVVWRCIQTEVVRP